MMKTIRAAMAALALPIAGLTMLAPQPAQAQVSGNDVRGILMARGYTDVVITKRSFTITRAEACQGGDKFTVKVNLLGKITSRFKIGTCGPRFGIQEAMTAMTRDGYNEIRANTVGDNIVAEGCLSNRKFELTYNLRGDLVNRTRKGRCASGGINPKDLRAQLRNEGYDRIKIAKGQGNGYSVEACNDRSRVRLTINRGGNVRTERRIGNCPGRIDPKNLAAVLQQQGLTRLEEVQTSRAPYMMRGCRDNDRVEMIISRYGDMTSETKIGKCRTPITSDQIAPQLEAAGYDRVRILRGNRTPYLVEACKATNLVELRINRFGKINSEEVVGRCAAPYSRADLNTELAKKGYFASEVTERNNGSFDVKACRGAQMVSFRVSRFGDFRKESLLGTCKSETVLDVLSTLESRGAEGVRLFVEGCFRNQAYRWSFDQLGNRTGRERINGTCQ